ARSVRDAEVAGSNPAVPTRRGAREGAWSRYVPSGRPAWNNRSTDAEAWTEAPHVPPSGRARLWTPHLPSGQAALPPRPARPRPAPPLGVPHPPAGEAEAPGHVRGPGHAVPGVPRRRHPQEGRDGR